MKKKIKCPHCGKLTSWENNPYRPFCSERCKLIDLGHWLSEEYRIQVPVEGLDEVHEIKKEE
ncbi:protein of unknown function DUF329 [Thermodesulfatator indicus DSM 15286]|uniref:DNA gyrase inhibitor YacG n=1 Tax=Thermodesulfatator indicus (strain DSM 15286 / JCM 11887 / CIR29812) TaxID=667014 RepID=F8A8L2_THEID|nr:DNA gyrase inhibitor YacG [Thermodesulfatator indicus]AEH45098.1 protein of unknown function DUF329 [Thermodesulfatator indicus DSM 15286]